MIPESTLQQIQERVDIVEIISAFVPLKNSGKNFKANCPFHHEKTPSFMVNPDKQIFHCFGCGAGGNVFTFLMKYEKKDFREVAEALAMRTGVEIPDDKADPAADARRAEFYQANRLAAEYFQRMLWNEETGKTARAYFKKRGLSEQTVKEFGLGFAPDLWDGLLTALKKQLSEKMIEKAGLALPGKENRLYDRFRKRVMFPIFDMKGQCVAFGARVLDDSLPKYLNSPETEVYTKGRHLYGLHQARTAIRTEDLAVVVEGYMDVIGCHQAGVKNVVASLGTALTGEQARLIRRHTKNVVILYDADAAGESATLRGLEIFLDEGMDVKIVRLPDGHDPDTFILKEGLPAFQNALHQAKNLFEYRLDLLKSRYPSKTVEGRVKIADEMVALLAKVPNEILKTAWMAELAKQLGLSEQSLQAEMRRSHSAESRMIKPDPEPAGIVMGRDVRAAEKMLLGLVLENKHFAALVRNRLQTMDFENASVRRIMERVFATPASEWKETSEWAASFRGEVEDAQVLALAVMEAEKTPDKAKALEDCLAWIERAKMNTIRQKLQTQIAEAHRVGDEDRIKILLKDFHELNKGMKKTHEKNGI